ncbi:MAG: hypothetical protein K5657_04685 [Desulfovibrio sp.]|nr:hypothetical protein [Desulfovibrio sp.]
MAGQVKKELCEFFKDGMPMRRTTISYVLAGSLLSLFLVFLFIFGSTYEKKSLDEEKNASRHEETALKEKVATGKNSSDGRETAGRDVEPVEKTLDPYLEEVKKEAEVEKENVVGLEERRHASAVLDFSNHAETAISANWFSRADLLAFFVRVYLGEWQLPLLPEPNRSRTSSLRDLLPPSGLFDSVAAAGLKDSAESMADRLESMHKDYAALQRYVEDPSIQDEGAEGKKLTSSMLKNYERFCAARRAYFIVLEKEADAAEALFLSEFPLKRQVVAAKHLFRAFRAVAGLLEQDKVERSAVQKFLERIRSLCAYAALPPFKGKPAEERQYRNFLKKVSVYCDHLARGLDEGFYPHVRKALNDDQTDCRIAYNEFAELLNTGAVR